MKWLHYFEHNRTHRRTIPWEKGVQLRGPLRPVLIRSLKRFQLGESGEGQHLRRQAARTGDPIYEAEIDLFIKEEQEHARLMARILGELRVPLLRFHWTDACFILLRRLFDLRTELLILLVPEMIARHYFRTLRDGCPGEVLRAVFGQILQDEEGHLAFHADYLNRAFQNKSFAAKVLVLAGWRMVFRAACLAVILDHGVLLRQLGVSAGKFWEDTGATFDEVAARIFSPSHVLSRPQLALPVL